MDEEPKPKKKRKSAEKAPKEKKSRQKKAASELSKDEETIKRLKVSPVSFSQCCD
jgi:hypothetical protein